jgi:phospholipid/cholesterol/gamma-HCH transport system permease protein
VSQETIPIGHRGAKIAAKSSTGKLHLTLSGRFDSPGVAAVWDQGVDSIRQDNAKLIVVDCADINYLDGAGVGMLLKLKEEAAIQAATLELTNVPPDHKQLIELTWESDLSKEPRTQVEQRHFFEAVAMSTENIFRTMKEMISFVGECAAMLAWAATNPSRIRWKDVIQACINVGVDSLFILCLIGFLMGLIMSFQSAVTLRQFGGEIFIPNMLGVVMFREMGPLVTAILLAARSGSAFAAEIGTMKINEELDALTTMGLSPMRFMVLPKLISTIFMIPFMTLFFNMASLVGGALVMLSLGFPLVTFTSRVFSYVGNADFFGGLTKAFVFALLVSGVGCLRGMQTKDGASAVGLSTTSAVVSGIVLIAFADGIFAVTFYFLGW